MFLALKALALIRAFYGVTFTIYDKGGLKKRCFFKAGFFAF